MGAVTSFAQGHMWIFSSPFFLVSPLFALARIAFPMCFPFLSVVSISRSPFISLFCWRSLLLCLIADSLRGFDLSHGTDKGLVYVARPCIHMHTHACRTWCFSIAGLQIQLIYTRHSQKWLTGFQSAELASSIKQHFYSKQMSLHRFRGHW